MSIDFIGIILFLVAFIAMFIIRFNRSRFIKKYEKLFMVLFIFVPSLLVLILFVVQNTDTKYDLYSVILFLPLKLFLIGIIEKITRSYTNLYFVFNTLVYLASFFIIDQLNMHLLDPISYLLIIIMLAIGIFRELSKRKDKKVLIVANVTGLLLVFITSWVLSIPYDGITKQERIAMEYLQEQKGYERSDIINIYNLTHLIGNEEREIFVEVQTINGIEDYILHYKSGEIVEVEER